MQTYPYPRPAQSLFHWHDWQVTDEAEPIDRWKDSLDSSRTYRCSVVLEIDPVFWELEYLPKGPLVMTVEAYCPSTLFRDVASTQILRDVKQAQLSVDIKGSAIAKSLELEASIITDQISASPAAPGPEIKAARLASSGLTRFTFSPSESVLRPTEVSFSATGRRNIPWEISSSFFMETDNFVANLMLHVNSDMGSVVAALERGAGKPFKWNLTYELMLYAVKALHEVVLEVDEDYLEITATEHPESLCAAVKKYATEAALSMTEILRLVEHSNGELESRLKEVASKIVEL